jgi:hypothetical protein
VTSSKCWRNVASPCPIRLFFGGCSSMSRSLKSAGIITHGQSATPGVWMRRISTQAGQDLPDVLESRRFRTGLRNGGVAVRIEIERVLRLLMISRNLEPRRGLGIGRALRELKESGGVPSGTDAFLQTLATMNEAAHGVRGGTRGSSRGPCE